MKERKRMGLPTARMLASRRTRVGPLSIARAAAIATAGASFTDASITRAVRAAPDGSFEDSAVTNGSTGATSLDDAAIANGATAAPDVLFEDTTLTNAVAALPDASLADDAMTDAVAAPPDASFTDNTITKLMARLDDGRRGEAASKQRRPLPSAPATFQPKVLRTRASRA